MIETIALLHPIAQVAAFFAFAAVVWAIVWLIRGVFG